MPLPRFQAFTETEAARNFRMRRNAYVSATMVLFFMFPSVLRHPRLMAFLDSSISGSMRQLDTGGKTQCEWTETIPLIPSVKPKSTLLASYPGSGLRLTWPQQQALTGIATSEEEFHLSFPSHSLQTTHYPHYEGQHWGSGDKKDYDQIVLILRNPRWALPEYFRLLQTEILNKPKCHKQDWTQWKDHRLGAELELWTRYIDFYMSNGVPYWDSLDNTERRGHIVPFYPRGEEPPTQDLHCQSRGCIPVSVVTMEGLSNVQTGPTELETLAYILQPSNITSEAVAAPHHTLSHNDAIPFQYSRTCSYLEGMDVQNLTQYNNITGHSPTPHYSDFTSTQLTQILNALQRMKKKYDIVKEDTQAINSAVRTQLVNALRYYIGELVAELIPSGTTQEEDITTPKKKTSSQLDMWYEGMWNQRDARRSLEDYTSVATPIRTP